MASEKRLIDATPEHIRVVLEKVPYYPDEIWKFTAMTERFPTVDTVEVVHGYWHVDDWDSGEPDGYAAFIEVHCSECGYELGAESGVYGWAYGDPFPLNYCPNCGAKMDGECK